MQYIKGPDAWHVPALPPTLPFMMQRPGGRMDAFFHGRLSVEFK